MRRGVVAALVGCVLLVGAVVALLVTGGASAPGAFSDPAGDVSVADGPKPPHDTAVVDVVDAQVIGKDSNVTFTARMNDDLPARVEKSSSLSWRWDVYVDGSSAWIVSADLDAGPTASVTSTRGKYGASTLDDTLPGTVRVKGSTLTVTLRPAELPDWPNDFTWTLTTTLDADRADPSSALATDTAPDEGEGRVGS